MSPSGDPPIDLEPLIDGGGHERGYRSGTLNVPAIVGFGKAAELCREHCDRDAARLRVLRDRLWSGLSSGLDGVHINGASEPRLPNNLNVRVDDVHGETLLKAIAGDFRGFVRCGVRDGERRAVARPAGDRSDRRRGARVASASVCTDSTPKRTSTGRQPW